MGHGAFMGSSDFTGLKVIKCRICPQGIKVARLRFSSAICKDWMINFWWNIHLFCICCDLVIVNQVMKSLLYFLDVFAI